MPDVGDVREIERSLRPLQARFHELVEPHLGPLYRYCVQLTGSPWDADDLAQETALRAFGQLHRVYGELNPRAYLFRIATNLFIDQTRRREVTTVPMNEAERLPEALVLDPADVEAATESLVTHLSPHERANVLLKDVFGFSLAECASFLGTSEGTVKSALHRGRAKLREHARSAAPPARALSEEDRRLAGAYADAFNRRDWDGIAALLHADCVSQIVGVAYEYGRAQIRQDSITELSRSPSLGEARVRELWGRIAVVVTDSTGRLSDVWGIDTSDGEIRAIRSYYFRPELLAGVGRAIGLDVAAHGYLYRGPTPAP